MIFLQGLQLLRSHFYRLPDCILHNRCFCFALPDDERVQNSKPTANFTVSKRAVAEASLRRQNRLGSHFISLSLSGTVPCLEDDIHFRQVRAGELPTGGHRVGTDLPREITPAITDATAG